MGAYFFRSRTSAGRAGLAILTAAAMAWPALTGPAAARGPDGIADVAEQVIDAVVNVSTKQSVDLRNGAMPQLPPGSPFEEFFEEFFKNRRGQPGQKGENGQGQNNQSPVPRRVNSLGSGFIVDAAGWPAFFVATAAAALPALMLLAWLQRRGHFAALDAERNGAADV